MDASIDFSGVLKGSIADGGGGGGGDTVIITPLVTSGTKIADVSVNGVEKDLYCPTPPTPPEIDITPVVTSGTKIADVSLNGVKRDLYAPNPTEISVNQVQQSGTKIATIGVNGVNTNIYAPEGVGEIIYSLNERIVGKWLDGRNIYERTYNVGSLSIGQNGTSITSVVDNHNEINSILSMNAISISEKASINLMSYISSYTNDIFAYAFRTDNWEYITLRYIKVS